VASGASIKPGEHATAGMVASSGAVALSQANAIKTLEAGVTTVRDLTGFDGADIATQPTWTTRRSLNSCLKRSGTSRPSITISIMSTARTMHTNSLPKRNRTSAITSSAFLNGAKGV
jgi:hypothetical protein